MHWLMASLALAAHGLSMLVINSETERNLMLSQRRTWLALALSALTLLSLPAQAKKQVESPQSYVTEQVQILGAVENQLILSVADLKKLPAQQVGTVPVVCQSGADMGKLQNLTGVLLKDLLEKAVIKAPEHNDVKKMIIIATASDGYKVVFSWSEVFNSALGTGVIVYFKKDGVPLGEDEGKIAMISTQDTRTGPRHVKWLQSLEVKKVAE
jgi:DMSO/TMAO reductase YedYZ molybdopterin-dependent catalytic subunit